MRTRLLSNEEVLEEVKVVRVELKGAARVFGEMEAPVVVLEEGALFEGQCRMATTRPDEAARDSSVIPLKRWEMLSQ